MHDRLFASRFGLTLCLGASLALLPGCSHGKVAVNATDVTIDKFSLHSSTRIAQGQTLTVKLPTNARSNFAWRLTPQSNEASHLQFVDRQDQVAPDNTIAYGDDEAKDIFAFTAGRPGMQTLEFIYDYQPGCPASKSRRMTLDVEVFNAREEAIAKIKEEQRMREEAEAIAAAQTDSDVQ